MSATEAINYYGAVQFENYELEQKIESLTSTINTIMTVAKYKPKTLLRYVQVTLLKELDNDRISIDDDTEDIEPNQYPTPITSPLTPPTFNPVYIDDNATSPDELSNDSSKVLILDNNDNNTRTGDAEITDDNDSSQSRTRTSSRQNSETRSTSDSDDDDSKNDNDDGNEEEEDEEEDTTQENRLNDVYIDLSTNASVITTASQLARNAAAVADNESTNQNTELNNAFNQAAENYQRSLLTATTTSSSSLPIRSKIYRRQSERSRDSSVKSLETIYRLQLEECQKTEKELRKKLDDIDIKAITLNRKLAVEKHRHDETVQKYDSLVMSIKQMGEGIKQIFNVKFETIDEALEVLRGEKEFYDNQYATMLEEFQPSSRYIIPVDDPMDEKETKITNILTTLQDAIEAQLEQIDNDIRTGRNEEAYFNSNPTDVAYIDTIDKNNPVEDYNISPSVMPEVLPFLRIVSAYLRNEKGKPKVNNDFNEDNREDWVRQFNCYMILMQKLLELYSQKYLNDYLDFIYDYYDQCVANNVKKIVMPKLVPPQTFQTNSLLYLMNTYNAKIYEPDRVMDFSNVVFNFLKPTFENDQGEALNLFQPYIGKRYNSILIYTPETVQRLERLRSLLNDARKGDKNNKDKDVAGPEPVMVRQRNF